MGIFWSLSGVAESPVETHEKLRPLTPTLYFENDGTFVKPNHNTDRHYTNGIGLSFPLSNYFGLVMGQMMFTPEDIETEQVVENDRPYAGYNFYGFFAQFVEKDQQLIHLQVDYGQVGPSTGVGEVQRFVHQVFDEPKPNGWDNQLPDEVTVQFYARYKKRFPFQKLWQIITQFEYAVGSVYHHLEGGALLRIGLNFPQDFGPGRLSDVALVNASTKKKGFYGYGFVRGAARRVERNLFLDGSLYQKSHHVEPEKTIAQVQVGGVWGWQFKKSRLDMTYSQTSLTKEFKHQIKHDSYGSLSLGWFWWF